MFIFLLTTFGFFTRILHRPKNLQVFIQKNSGNYMQEYMRQKMQKTPEDMPLRLSPGDVNGFIFPSGKIPASLDGEQ